MSYYSILEVPEDSPVEVIKAAYRRKLLQVHPDKQQIGATTSASNAVEICRLQEAFNVLKNPHTRAVYDSQLRSEQLRCRFEGIPWMTIQVSDMDLVEDTNGQPLYEYECRCGGVFELSTDHLHHLAQGPAQLTCLHCTSSLEVTSSHHT